MNDQLTQELFRQIGIMTQSISQLNHDYTAISQQNAAMQADVAWLMKFFWIIATASIGSFMTALWQIFNSRKNTNGINK